MEPGMKHILALAALALAPTLAFADPAVPAAHDPSATYVIDEAGGLPADYALVWADEFEANGLPDPSRWTYDTHANRTGWYNNERQYYSPARAENARVEGGNLIIEARRERLTSASDYGGQNFTSSRMITNGLASWTYGYFEIRAKLPCGYGVWPAIWMLAANGDSWPVGGEIDIMEHVGTDPGVVHGTVHTGAFNHSRGNHRTAQVNTDACDAFHNYQMTWTPERITIGLDGRNYYQYVRGPSDGRDAWPFDNPQYLLLNVAIGGWGGDDMARVAQTTFPARMEVDYVRVYQRAP
jgi:beta-glucanase (GH16 family)